MHKFFYVDERTKDTFYPQYMNNAHSIIPYQNPVHLYTGFGRELLNGLFLYYI